MGLMKINAAYLIINLVSEAWIIIFENLDYLKKEMPGICKHGFQDRYWKKNIA